jgi:integrase/recombinase XerD
MAKGKQAKILTAEQFKKALEYVSNQTRQPERNRLMLLLGASGLRAKEIASITLSMVTDAEGNVSETISLDDIASKGKSGRMVPVSSTLKIAITEYLKVRGNHQGNLIQTERSEAFSSAAVCEWFKRIYTTLGFEGASSHSLRRGFITQAARKIPLCGGSLVDVMKMVGHRHLSTTQRYIEQDTEAQRKVVEMLFAAV